MLEKNVLEATLGPKTAETVTNILYLFTLPLGTNTQKLSPTYMQPLKIRGKSSKLSSHDEDIDQCVFEDDNFTGTAPFGSYS